MDIVGKTFRDIVSGFEGICTGAAERMLGCRLHALRPRSDGASRKEKPSLFCANQLKPVDEGVSDKIEAPSCNCFGE